MSNVEALKEQARRHEQKEEWQKACDQYMLAIAKLDDEEQVDIGLYNRVGDLLIRTGDFERAVEHFDKAADLYVESELPNNAIAICKKVIRHLPNRFEAYLRMGRIRAEQGFLLDARDNFITYAEKVQAAGDMEEALRALVEFAELAPEDTEIRMAVAGLLIQNERSEEALEQLAAGYSVVRRQENEELIAAFEARIQELDPDADLDAMAEEPPTAADYAFNMGVEEPADDVFGDFGDIALPGEAPEEAETPADTAAGASAPGRGEEESEEVEFGGFAEIAIGGDEGDAGEAVESPSDDPSAGAGGFADFALPTDDDEAEAGVDTLAGAFLDAEEDDGGDLHLEAALEDEGADSPFEAALEETAHDSADDEDDFALGADLPLMSFDDEGEEDAGGEDEGFSAPDEGFSVPDDGFSAPEDALEESAPLPLLSDEDDDEDDDEEAVTVDGQAEVDVEGPDDGHDLDEAEPLPFLSDDDEEEATAGGDQLLVGEAVETPGDEAGEEGGDAAPGVSEARSRFHALRATCEENPADAESAQSLVELAFKLDDQAVLVDAYLILAGALARGGDEARAQGVYQQVLSLDPENEVARTATAGADSETGASSPAGEESPSGGGYVDLGSLIFDDDQREKTTRFTVAYEEPTGDEDADFARMLSQFKAKVAENFDHSDVKAHHDLGTAYKEMGLLDEAVEKFQEALRASPVHLPTYELLGQTFMEKGEGVAAVRVLERALKVPHNVEDELIGIYYYLARAHEETGNKDSAVEFYDRVFSLDINFADVTERLRRLRPS
jgi:tetratricopeptide (TPR) repeat protein